MTNISPDQIIIRHIASMTNKHPTGRAQSGNLLILTFLIDQNLGMHHEIESGWPQEKCNLHDKLWSLIQINKYYFHVYFLESL